jgi:hypothetical protein
MLPIRQSLARTSNERMHHEAVAKAPRSNVACLQAANAAEGLGLPGDVVLIGGASLADFRVRGAQAYARHDFTPSHWSLVGILSGPDQLITVPLGPIADISSVPASNGIVGLPLATFDDPAEYPNFAVVRFPSDPARVLAQARALRRQRPIVDLPNLLLVWLGYVWGTGTSNNPLVGGLGVPSAVLVETAFGMADFELTPGLASASSCPEAIWQSARWWHKYYAASAPAEADARSEAAVPIGWWVVRQGRASYIVPSA